ncbi:kininogen-1 isoform X2 [Callorhinchus milii]|uniref:kininogen-1 isoform X2 n=1 Tax=Callorhinchus milii TaxID=7868 RepID=UPI0004575CAD|nr:kininogen-1 isoform X2 [Callorhinchus milii]|eukprot:gi/632934047/ref/XP_007897578.1/ PREDICTED: T-kininogen 2-like isoform X2 [Callorhinchus milii]
MKLFVVLLFSSQLLHSNARSVSDIDSVDPIPIDCDDPELLKAVDFTLRKFNGERRTTHQYALDRVSFGTVQRKRGSRYFIKFDIQESNCLVESEKTWTECDHRPPTVANIGHCESSVYIHRAGRILEVTMYNCTIIPVNDPWIVPKIAPCLGCAISLPHNSSRAKETLDYSIKKFNSDSNYPNIFGSEVIFKVTSQVVAGYLYTLKFSLRETECTKSSNDVWQDCILKPDNATTMEGFRSQPTETIGILAQQRQRHRQHHFYQQQDSHEQHLINKSEQSNPAVITTSAPLELPLSAIDQLADLLGPEPPVNCPGKPWKPLRHITPTDPVSETVPPPLNTAEEGEQPKSDGFFFDFDLLAGL